MVAVSLAKLLCEVFERSVGVHCREYARSWSSLMWAAKCCITVDMNMQLHGNGCGLGNSFADPAIGRFV